MITIRQKGNEISVGGHANYDDHGKDIVCASVSSIIYTTINAILSFDEKAIKFVDEKVMKIILEKDTKEVNVLINNMFNLLQDLEKQYPENLNIM